MNLAATLALAVTLFFLPLAWMLVDSIGGMRSKHSAAIGVGSYAEEDFAVLVPIYGSVAYLENVDFLADYGSRVVLCTTTRETDEFNAALQAIASTHGFRTFYTDAVKTGTAGKRDTGGTVRDTVIRDVLPHLTEQYVVCIDADTTTVEPLQRLVGAMSARGLDVASVRLVPSNAKNSILTRLQAYEYRLAMRLRIVAPWLVSGACHAGRTTVMREIMARHSMFFQGNDVELGVLADAMNFTVGHVPFEVPTAVPETFRAWWRQHLAWAGGEFRLFVVNAKLGFRHPFFWSYGLILTILLLPLRWTALVGGNWVLLTMVVLYIALGLYLHWSDLDFALLLMPFYAAFVSLVLVPLGLWSYCSMAYRSRNAGIIRVPNRDELQEIELRIGQYSSSPSVA
ncbi:glycosyltransferase family 2 protein [Actinomycetospora atypica]|uniref:Glycosyltransferase family 2 protein n=1 Tax=Actinomycetospora atypica TaxID=1290095 RepID=A0ABV9YIU2_9PSEU